MIRRVDATFTGGESPQVTGVSELVRGRQARFLTDIGGKSLKVLYPAETELAPDSSPQFRYTRLYIEIVLRKAPNPSRSLDRTSRGDDDLPFQLDPALQVLN